MSTVNSNNAPDASVVKPHFIFGSLSLFVLSILVIIADNHLLGSYFNAKIVAITHMAVLGWAIMIIFGALYQLIPVVFETSLYSEKLAKITFWLFGTSILFLTYTFWIGAYSNLLLYAASLMFISLLLFIINILLSYKNSKLKNISSKFVVTAVFWLSITEIIGILIAFNFNYQFLSKIHLHYLKIHATIGMVGWFLSLIIGVSSILLPMFFVSHQLNTKKLKRSFYFINSGLLLLVINWFFIHHFYLTILFWALIVIGIIFYLSFVYDSYTKRMRKALDIGMKHTVISIVSVVLPIFISLAIALGLDTEQKLIYSVITIYGFSIIFGFITTLILGQTYKTLPFVVWLEKYKGLVGKTKTPMPRELYSEKIAYAHLYIYVLFVILMLAGLVFNNIILVRAGSYVLLIVAILYNINIFKIIFHNVKTEIHED